MEKKRIILIGGGGRGKTYSSIGKELDKFELVAIAEPVRERRDFISKAHNIPSEMQFESWEPLLALGKIADAAIIATMDRDHYAPAIEAIDLGYDLLLEKPISPTPEECLDIARRAEEKGVKVLICHVLRFTPFFRALKAIIDSGRIGRVMNIIHTEGVGNVHHSHSFVRGNWGNSERSSFMLLQKSCHDMDILQWLLGKRCTRVHSFGSLSYFTPENAPEGATDRCFDGCPHLEDCVYSAKRLYLEREDGNWFKGSATKMHSVPDDETVMSALADTNYGRCVFRCDNDVVDHQTVNMEFEGGTTVSFNMSAFNLGGRKIRIMGTKGEIIGEMGNPNLTLNDLTLEKSETICISDAAKSDSITAGHGGGDYGIMDSFYDLLCGKEGDVSICTISESAYNHMLAFAAEHSRLSGRVVSLDEYIEKVKSSMH